MHPVKRKAQKYPKRGVFARFSSLDVMILCNNAQIRCRRQVTLSPFMYQQKKPIHTQVIPNLLWMTL